MLYFANKHPGVLVFVCKMLYLANKHPAVLVFVCLISTQTPIHLGVYLQSITFSYTPEEAMLVELAKACVCWEIIFC